MAEKLRVGVVGGGSFGSVHLRAYRQMQADGQGTLVALCDLSEKIRRERGQEYAIPTYAALDEMLAQADLNAVSVATPDHLHREVVLKALAAGKHVLVEKPLDVTVAGAREMAEAARKKGLHLQVDFHKRYDPYHRNLASTYQRGEIGELLYGYVWMENRLTTPRQILRAWAAKTTCFWFLGSHMCDLLYFVTRLKVRRVFTHGQKKKVAGEGVDTWDYVAARLEFENGAVVNMDTCFVLPESFEGNVRQGVRLVGTEGFLQVDSQNRGSYGCTSKEGPKTHNIGFMLKEADAELGYRYAGYGVESIVDFGLNVNRLLAGAKPADLPGPHAGAADGLENVKVLAAVHESLAKNQWVDVG